MLVNFAQGRLLKFFSLTDIRVSTVDRFIETSQLIGELEEARSKEQEKKKKKKKKIAVNCFCLGFIYFFR